MKTLFITTLVLLFSTIAIANDRIEIKQHQYFIDVDKKLVLTNIKVDYVNSTWTNAKAEVLLNEACVFSDPIATVEIGKAYEIFIPSQNSNFTLYFTQLPIISINTPNTIIDASNVLASFKMIESNDKFLESNIGIQFRGASSQSWPKKPMEFEFWDDTEGIKTHDYALLDMVKNDDWNLQAMYNEPLRVRSKTNNELWRMINQLHYQAKEPDAINGIRMRYVELFLNNEYRGLYCLGEKVNRKQLKLKKHNGTIRGELYKGVSWGASTFLYVYPYDNKSLIWSGFEYKHPEEEINWSNIHGFVNFVVNTPNQNFYADYKNRFEFNNLVDYYIFLNLLRATDNAGKNIYIAKYDTNDKYFYVPWDLDGSFGTIWDGTNDNTTNDLLSNGFYQRLIKDFSPDGFKKAVKDKWLKLRSDVVTQDYLMSLFNTNHDSLVTNGVYEREIMAWPTYKHDAENLNYMSSWIKNRLAYLDVKFVDESEATLTVSASAVNVSKIASNTNSVNVNSNTDWTASSNQTWLTVTTNNTGNKALAFRVSANNTITERQATITLKTLYAADKTITIIQAAGDGRLSVSATAGGLAAAIDNAGFNANNITELTVTGEIDARDFVIIRENMTLLEMLDLSGAKIVEYIGDETDSNLIGTFAANEIPDSALTDIENLISIKMPNTATAIGKFALAGCTALKNIYIGRSVQTIGHLALITINAESNKTSSLEDLIVSPENQNFASQEGVLFNKDYTTLIQFPAAKTGAYSISSSVTKIENYAFANCKELTSVSIPVSVSSIGDYSFLGCTNLAKIYSFSKTPIDLSNNEDTFEGVNKSTCKLYVPIGSGNAYKEAIQWKDFGANIEASLTAAAYGNPTLGNKAIYPNPVINTLNFGYNPQGIERLEVVDCTGRTLVLSTAVTTNSINVSNLIPGIYTLRVNYMGTVLSNRFIKK